MQSHAVIIGTWRATVDANNHVQVQAKLGDLLTVQYTVDGTTQTRAVKIKKPDQVFNFAVEK